MDGGIARATDGEEVGRTGAPVADGGAVVGDDTDAVGAGAGINTRGGIDGSAVEGAGAADPRDARTGVGATADGARDAATVGGGAVVGDSATVGGAVLGDVTGPAGSGAGALGNGAPDVAAVPRAAGIEDAGRGGADAARRGAAGWFGAEGASIVISSVRPTNPIRSAPMPNSNRVFSGTPRRSGGRE
jgi:hypothetical protein